MANFGMVGVDWQERINWDAAIGSQTALVPAAYAWNAAPPTVPDADGRYPIPMPGMTPAF